MCLFERRHVSQLHHTNASAHISLKLRYDFHLILFFYRDTKYFTRLWPFIYSIVVNNCVATTPCFFDFQHVWCVVLAAFTGVYLPSNSAESDRHRPLSPYPGGADDPAEAARPGDVHGARERPDRLSALVQRLPAAQENRRVEHQRWVV